MVKNSWKSFMVKSSMLGSSLNKGSTYRSIVSCKEILVKCDSTWKATIIKLEL